MWNTNKYEYKSSSWAGFMVYYEHNASYQTSLEGFGSGLK